LIVGFAVKTDRVMVALAATMATAPPALAVSPDMVTRSSVRMLLVLVRIPPPLLAAPAFPFSMEIPATLSRAPAATSKMRKSAATAGSRRIVVPGPPTIARFRVITGRPSMDLEDLAATPPPIRSSRSQRKPAMRASAMRRRLSVFTNSLDCRPAIFP
jgi:hypothetical protein